MTELKVERTRRYKVVRPDVTVSFEDGAYGFGDEFDHVFTPEDEWTHVDSGLLGIVPESYEVIGSSELEVNLIEAPAARSVDPVSDADLPTQRVAKPGETFEAAIPLAREAQLIHHVRRVPSPAKPAPAAKPSKKE